jgi:hypothetical protein
MKFRYLSISASLAALFLLYVMGLGMRRLVIETQYRTLGADFPFTLESALHYRRVKMIHDTGEMPAVDLAVQYPEGVNVPKTYEFGSEYVQAWLAHGLPKSLSVGDRLRWIESGWFCLGIPMMALWIFWRTGSRWAGMVAAGFYAVMISSVIRSTGQELSKENFALPLLVAHLAFDALADLGRRLQWSAVSALFLAAALWNWDLIQYYVMLWAIVGGWQSLRGTFGRSAAKWLVCFLALVVVGLASPYYRAHGFLWSPAMLLACGVAGHWALQRLCPAAGSWRLLAVVIPLGLGLPLVGWLGYGSSYGHFAELLWAKIRFLNHKPADPSLLSFESRIMWVPALHSATIPLTFSLFPAILPLSFIAAPVALRSRQHPEIGHLVFHNVVSLLAFCFFVRFHVFLALFAAALAGCWVADAAGRATRWKVMAAVLLSCGFVAEAGNTAYRPERWGRGNVYYAELKALAAWLREHAAPDAVLANFGTSGPVAAYGKCPVILHPKFESKEARTRVREYGEQLFKGTEIGFRDWADRHGAEYYVYAKGEFSERSPEMQMRYFVNALKPAEDAPARLFEFHPERLKLFRYAWGNTKYSVFKIRTRADEVAAGRHARQAQEALQRGDLALAEQEAMEALRRNPDEALALDVVRHASVLKESGFGRGVHEGN